jgi:hypothetical protein
VKIGVVVGRRVAVWVAVGDGTDVEVEVLLGVFVNVGGAVCVAV